MGEGNAFAEGRCGAADVEGCAGVGDDDVVTGAAGIPEDRYEDVFRPFFRLESSRNPETGGTGLGLTIARDVARSPGGELELLDSPQGGLCARLWLPA